MSIESYKNYTVRGFAKQMGDGSFEAFGTVQKDHLVLEASEPAGIPGAYLVYFNCSVLANANSYPVFAPFILLAL